jgi:predicted transcriptional regulator
VLTPKQLRAGRIFLGWTRATLAKHSGVSVEAIRAFEVRGSDPRLTTIGKLRGALERGGLELVDDDGERGPGVRLRKSTKRKTG